ncbi:MAG: Gfo/Idh/MocA family oxidoreductase [Phycisphaerae bacterium]|jgi:predicted dehydrogenase
MIRQDHRVRIGIIDGGNRGSSYVRLFDEQPGCSVDAYADLDQSRLERLSRTSPKLRVTTDFEALLADGSLDAVVIATPTTARAHIAKRALMTGKHVFSEAPLCTNTRETRELSALAESAGLVLMVGYALLLDERTARIRALVTGGELGRIRYLDAVRTGAGPVHSDVSALYDLGAHDIRLFTHLLDTSPAEVSAAGTCLDRIDTQDVCFVTLKYPDGVLGHMHISRLNPRDTNTLTVVGDRRTVHWDSDDPARTLRIYETVRGDDSRHETAEELEQRCGENIVRMINTERCDPFVRQVQTFLNAVAAGAGRAPLIPIGSDVTKVLEAATRSMKTGGAMCPVETTPIVSKSAWARIDSVTPPPRRQPVVTEPDAAVVAPAEEIIMPAG